MKTILIYGDSNTWGAQAFDGRYDHAQQWPNILQAILGGNYHVVQAGLRGRIAGDYDAVKPHRNGKVSYEVTLRSAEPVDYVIIALGSNDIKATYDRTSKQIFDDLMWYRNKTTELMDGDTTTGVKPRMIYVGIPNNNATDYYAPRPGVREKVNDLLLRAGESYAPLDHLTISDDGVHFTDADHQIVAQKVFEQIREFEQYIERGPDGAGA